MTKFKRNLCILAVWVVFASYSLLSFNIMFSPEHYEPKDKYFEGNEYDKLNNLVYKENKFMIWKISLFSSAFTPAVFIGAIQMSKKLNEEYKRVYNVQSN